MHQRCFRVVIEVVLVTGTLLAQTNLKITGEVVDGRTHAPLVGANVTVMGSRFGGATDGRGRFEIRDLPPGHYRLEIRMLGYRPRQLDIDVDLDLPTNVRAQLEPEPIPFPAVVVTAEAARALHPSASTTVIDRAEILRRQPESVVELLNDLAGLQVLAEGGVGRPARLSIRGSATNQVLVLLDGQRLNTAQTGVTDLRTIPINWVEKIEIVKGGSSAIHGGEAIGGVVNIVTRGPGPSRRPEIHVRSSLGSFGARSVSPSFGTQLGRLRILASYRGLRTDGDFPYRTFADPPRNSILIERLRENAWNASDNLFLKITATAGQRYQFEFSGQHYSARMGIPGPEIQLTPEARQVDRRSLFGFQSRLLLAPWAFAEVLAYYHHFFQEYEAPPPATYIFHNRHQNRATGAETRLHLRAPKSLITFGYAVRDDRLQSKDLIRPARSLGERSRITHSFFGQMEINVYESGAPQGLRFEVIPGYRIDSPSDRATAYSPKLGAVLSYGNRPAFTVKGNIGKAYRAPTLNSLFWVPDAFALGNPHLRPERSTNRDLGFGIRMPVAGELLAEVTWFRNDIQDIIVWQRQFDGRFRPVNVARARNRGREDRLIWQTDRGRLQVELNHTFLDAINRSGERVTDGKQLVFRPRHRTSLRIAAQIAGFRLEARRRWVSKRYIREANTKFLKAYSVTELQGFATVKWGSWKLKLGGKLNNLTDENYRLIEGYPMPGRSWRMFLEIDLGDRNPGQTE